MRKNNNKKYVCVSKYIGLCSTHGSCGHEETGHIDNDSESSCMVKIGKCCCIQVTKKNIKSLNKRKLEYQLRNLIPQRRNQ